jgi:glycosyltransferase involved in cell wall biosynthesis
LKQANSDTIKLVISGQKSWLFESVLQLINDLGLKDDVIFTGPVTEEEKITLMQGAQVFVFPAIYEGFGLMVLEAFATQTPVVIADNSSLPEVAGDAALKVPTMDHKAMAEAIGKLLADKSLRQKLTELGRKRAENFSWEKAAKFTLDYLKEAVEIHAA